MPHVVMHGAHEGWVCYGVFATQEEAREWAVKNLPRGQWHTMEIELVSKTKEQ